MHLRTTCVLLVGGVFLLLLSIWHMSRTVYARVRVGHPSLFTPRLVIDLGSIPSGMDQTVAFPIQNHGTARLVINERDHGCGCVDPGRKTMIVAPGEKVELPILFETQQASGFVEQVTSFITSDPVRAEFRLTIRAQVDAPVTLLGNSILAP